MIWQEETTKEGKHLFSYFFRLSWEWTFNCFLGEEEGRVPFSPPPNLLHGVDVSYCASSSSTLHPSWPFFPYIQIFQLALPHYFPPMCMVLSTPLDQNAFKGSVFFIWASAQISEHRSYQNLVVDQLTSACSGLVIFLYGSIYSTGMQR